MHELLTELYPFCRSITGDGILVHGGDSLALAEAIQYLWENPEKVEVMVVKPWNG